jgi:hypothetical protein
MATRPQGFGRQLFGFGLMGSGGPLSVVRAVAVSGQTVRVVFNEEPVHQSAAGAIDALNPANYFFTVPGGNATSPVPVGVDPHMVIGPTYVVGNGGNTDERGFDVAVDRQLIVGVTYQVTVRNLQSKAGGVLGSPASATFPGVTELMTTLMPARNQDLIDFANPPALGHWVFDSTEDIASEAPADGTKKRIYRRGFTRKNAYSFLNGYGCALNHKGVASIPLLAAFRVDYQGQIKQEPDVSAASVDVNQLANGVTLIDVDAKTIRGAFVDQGAQISAVGAMSPT